MTASVIDYRLEDRDSIPGQGRYSTCLSPSPNVLSRLPRLIASGLQGYLDRK
jgi:hypothetical protein